MKTLKVLLIVICLVIIGCNTSIKNETDSVNKKSPIPTLSTPSPIIQLSITPSILLTIKPTSSITAEPSPVLTLSPTFFSSPISPSPSTLDSLCETEPQEAARIVVFDEQGQFVDDATIKAEVDRTGNFGSEVYTIKNVCMFRKGAVITKTYQGIAIIEIIGEVPIKYTVSKAGYITKELTVILINMMNISTLIDIYFGCPASNLNLPYLVHCSDGVPPLSLSIYGGSKYALSKIPLAESLSPSSSSGKQD